MAAKAEADLVQHGVGSEISLSLADGILKRSACAMKEQFREKVAPESISSELQFYMCNYGGQSQKEERCLTKNRRCTKRKLRRCEHARMRQAYQKNRLSHPQEVLYDGITS